MGPLTTSCFLAALLTWPLYVLCLGGRRNLSMFPISTGGSARKGPRSNRKHERTGKSGSARSGAQEQHDSSGGTGSLHHRMQCSHPPLCHAPAGRQHTARSAHQSATSYWRSQPGRRRVYDKVSCVISIFSWFNMCKHDLSLLNHNPYLWSLKVSLNSFTFLVCSSAASPA